MIPKTYHDGNPEDRAYVRDLWSWLQRQPQDAWLLWARTANWDNAGWIYERMIENPDCDRAIVSWLFWKSGPDHVVDDPTAFDRSSLIGRIVDNSGRGFYRQAELTYDRYEVVHEVHAYLAALAKPLANAPFPLPRELCGPFAGRPARLPETYDQVTEDGLSELFRHLDGGLPRSEQQYRAEEARNGNLWIKSIFRLPRPPADPNALHQLDDRQFLESIFGKHSAYIKARSAHRGGAAAKQARGASRLGAGDKLILKLLAAFAVLAIGGAALARLLQTGSW